MRDAGIAWEVHGPESGAWIVLSHSLAASSAMWIPQIRALGRRFRVLTYDHRGHGRSATPGGVPSVEAFAADVVALMDEVGIERAHIVGLSLGGTVGLAVGLAAPERVETIVCACARASATPAYGQAMGQRAELARTRGLEHVADVTLPKWFTDEFTESPSGREVVDAARRQIVGTGLEGYLHCIEALRAADLEPSLPRLTRPVLYVGAELDQAVPVDVLRRMQAATPGAEMLVIRGAAHLCNLEQPAAFEAALGNWFDRHA